MEPIIPTKAPLLFHRPETLRFHRSAIERVLKLMREDPGAQLNWDVLSKTACISRFHFLRIFEGLTDVSPHRFLMALRMEKAKRLLLESRISVTEIAMKTGYVSVATFVRVFKMLVGLTPSVFRQNGEALSLAELNPLLVVNSGSIPNEGSVRVRVRMPPEFTGIIFAGLFPSTVPQGPLIDGAVINKNVPQEFDIAIPTAVGFLQVVACPHPDSNEVKDYLLWNGETMLAASSLIYGASANAAQHPKILDLSLQYRSQFDPPVVPSLPLLLADLVKFRSKGN